MTVRQRIILIVLGVLDLAVIAALATVVVTQSAAPPMPTAPAPIPVDPCVDALLQAMAGTAGTATVAWTAQSAQITVYTEATAEPPEQRLWDLLDELPAPLPSICPVPETVTLHLAPSGEGIHTAQLEGRALAAWLAGATSDAELAGTSRYRAID